MVQQGRLLAAALAERGPIDPADAQAILVRLDRRRDGAAPRRRSEGGRCSRTRAASARGARAGDEPRERARPARTTGCTALVSSAARLAAGARRRRRRPRPRSSTPAAGPLQRPRDPGRPRRAATARRRASAAGQRSLTLYSAHPGPRATARVVGAVLVSQSTWRLLQRPLRRPARDPPGVPRERRRRRGAHACSPRPRSRGRSARLRAEAAALLDRRGRLRGRFGGSARRDEIGELARALEELSQRLEQRTSASWSRSRRTSPTPSRTRWRRSARPRAPRRRRTTRAARARYQALVERDVARLERLLATAREIARIDAGLEDEERASRCPSASSWRASSRASGCASAGACASRSRSAGARVASSRRRSAWRRPSRT